MLILHTCQVDGEPVDHEADVPVERTVKLGCGCLRYRGTRCDGTPVEWLSDTCSFHTLHPSP